MLKSENFDIDSPISYEELEYVAYIIECLTNVNTLEKEKIFNDVCSYHSKLNYEEISKARYWKSI